MFLEIPEFSYNAVQNEPGIACKHKTSLIDSVVLMEHPLVTDGQ